MKYIIIQEEDNCLIVSLSKRVLRAYTLFLVAYCIFSGILALFTVWTGLVVKSHPQPWYLYLDVILFPSISLLAIIRLVLVQRNGESLKIFIFDREAGSVCHNSKIIAGGDRVRSVSVLPHRFAWPRGYGGPVFSVHFEGRRPIEILSVSTLTAILPRFMNPSIVEDATEEVLNTAARVAQHMGVSITNDSTSVTGLNGPF